MSILQEQAVQMIGRLSDDNVGFLIDIMQRFMMPKDREVNAVQAMNTLDSANFMQEIEAMRMKAKSYFPRDFDSEKVWEEAVDQKYGSLD